jgi:hypothetical protein
MGPPQKPADKLDKPLDINDLNDLVTSSGIDIREEENYLAQSYRNQHHTYQPQQAQGYQPVGARLQHTNTSFSSTLSQSPSSATSPISNYQTWNGQQGSFSPFQYGAGGPIHDLPVTQHSVEEELEAKHKIAARRLAESRQYHLNDPFVQPENLRPFVQKRTYPNGVKMVPDGLEPSGRFPTLPGQPVGARADVRMGSQDGRLVGITEARAQSLLASETAQSEIYALVSLAAQERIRTLLEEAYALSRSRQLSSHGLVPPDWADIATGVGKVEQTTAALKSISGTAWDSPSGHGKSSEVTSLVTPQKRPAPDNDTVATSNINLPTPPTDTPPSPLQTHKYPAIIPESLKRASGIDRKLEENRLSRRTKRRKTSADTPGSVSSPSSTNPGDNANLGSTNPNTPKATSSTTSAPASDSKAPGTPSQSSVAPRMTKKERERASRVTAQTGEALYKNANTTASMALQGFGKRYSWLSGGGAGASRSGTSTPLRAGAGGGGPGTPGAGVSGPASGGIGGAGVRGPLWAKERKWGDWKEDGKQGRGIQSRDWARAMEVDGKVLVGYMRAWHGMKSTV